MKLGGLAILLVQNLPVFFGKDGRGQRFGLAWFGEAVEDQGFRQVLRVEVACQFTVQYGAGVFLGAATY